MVKLNTIVYTTNNDIIVKDLLRKIFDQCVLVQVSDSHEDLINLHRNIRKFLVKDDLLVSFKLKIYYKNNEPIKGITCLLSTNTAISTQKIFLVGDRPIEKVYEDSFKWSVNNLALYQNIYK